MYPMPDRRQVLQQIFRGRPDQSAPLQPIPMEGPEFPTAPGHNKRRYWRHFTPLASKKSADSNRQAIDRQLLPLSKTQECPKTVRPRRAVKRARPFCCWILIHAIIHAAGAAGVLSDLPRPPPLAWSSPAQVRSHRSSRSSKASRRAVPAESLRPPASH